MRAMRVVIGRLLARVPRARRWLACGGMPAADRLNRDGVIK